LLHGRGWTTLELRTSVTETRESRGC
jgi:hypothetical protein